MFDFIISDDPESNVTDEFVDEFEKRWSIKFPEVLRTYYTNYQFAEIEERPFVVLGMEFCVEFIMPLVNSKRSVEKILEINEGNEWIPRSFIPLAVDIDADNYYWDSNDGKVYYLTVGNIENPIPICDSVEEFFKLMSGL